MKLKTTKAIHSIIKIIMIKVLNQIVQVLKE